MEKSKRLIIIGIIASIVTVVCVGLAVMFHQPGSMDDGMGEDTNVQAYTEQGGDAFTAKWAKTTSGTESNSSYIRDMESLPNGGYVIFGCARGKADLDMDGNPETDTGDVYKPYISVFNHDDTNSWFRVMQAEGRPAAMSVSGNYIYITYTEGEHSSSVGTGPVTHLESLSLSGATRWIMNFNCDDEYSDKYSYSAPTGITSDKSGGCFLRNHYL